MILRVVDAVTSSISSSAEAASNSSEAGLLGAVERRRSARRNSVQVVAPEDKLSVAEKFKQIKAHEAEVASSGASVAASTSVEVVPDLEKQQPKEAGAVGGKEGQEQQQQQRLSEDFHTIFLFGDPVFFHRGVEACMLLNCLYLAFWLSEFVTIAQQVDESRGWSSTVQFLM